MGIEFTCEKCGGSLTAKVRPEAGNYVSISLCGSCMQSSASIVSGLKEVIAKYEAVSKATNG